MYYNLNVDFTKIIYFASIIFFKFPVPKIRARGLFDGTEYLRIYGILLYMSCLGSKVDWDFWISDPVKNPDGTDV